MARCFRSTRSPPSRGPRATPDAGAAEARERALDALRAAWTGLAGEARAELAAAVRSLGPAEPAAAEPRPPGRPLPEVLGSLGIGALRPGQDRAIAAALAGRDALVVMATGSGKSLCYQAPALALGGLSVVVSPLIALMDDQVAGLRAAGLPAAALTSRMGEADLRETMAAVDEGRIGLLYCAPERFNSRAFVAALRRRGVELFVVDEAHCVSEWGHDFRPDYRRVRAFREAVGARATIALTATATPAVQGDIVRRLGLRDHAAVVTGFDRPNLVFDCASVSGRGAVARKWELLRTALDGARGEAAIVYSGTRRAADELAERLAAEGHATAPYHAGRSDREAVFDAFMSGRARVMCATNAFGMGVDKPDVRLIVHWAIPDSLEQYYQEAGRAGRDGELSRALLISSSGDVGQLRTRIAGARLGAEEVDALLGRLARRADEDGVFRLERGEVGDRVAFELAMAERVGAVESAPAAGGARAGRLLRTRLDAEGARALGEEVGRELGRRRRALDAVLDYAGGDECRRARILRHFGDPADSGAPEGRCCDVCDPPADLAAALGREVAAPAGGRGRRADELADALPAEARTAFAALRAWRAAAAKELGWPAFRVAPNRTLVELARRRPSTPYELEQVPGAGPYLRERFGTDLLSVLAAATAARPRRAHPAAAGARPAGAAPVIRRRRGRLRAPAGLAAGAGRREAGLHGLRRPGAPRPGRDASAQPRRARGDRRDRTGLPGASRRERPRGALGAELLDPAHRGDRPGPAAGGAGRGDQALAVPRGLEHAPRAPADRAEAASERRRGRLGQGALLASPVGPAVISDRDPRFALADGHLAHSGLAGG